MFETGGSRSNFQNVETNNNFKERCGDSEMVKAYILLNCETGPEQYIIDELTTIPGVKEAHRIIGAYNIMAEMESSSLEELQKAIIFKIRKMDMIKSTLTLVGVDGQGYSTY